MREKDGHVGAWTHAGQGVQETRVPDNVIRITRHKARGIETEHPAVFPAALPTFVMETYSDPGEVCYEPFSGSGTSIVAAERLGRIMRAIELAPEYCDVAVLRFRQQFPAVSVTLEGDGRTWEQVATERQKGQDNARP